jgi:hypothetical protein
MVAQEIHLQHLVIKYVQFAEVTHVLTLIKNICDYCFFTILYKGRDAR